MTTLLWVSLASLATGLLSLVGGLALLYRQRLSTQVLRYLVSFAAGAMLAAAFLDVLPEALRIGEGKPVLWFVLAGMILFFITEKFLLWHHHSHEHSPEEVKPTGPLIIMGDTLHNFLDGITITITFLASLPLGIITTIAIICHEIPQEIGDFAVLLDAGYAKRRVLIYNLLSSLATLVGAWGALLLARQLTAINPELLGVAAGSFIYIAAADLIPEIHRESDTKRMSYQVLALLIGVLTIWAATVAFD